SCIGAVWKSTSRWRPAGTPSSSRASHSRAFPVWPPPETGSARQGGTVATACGPHPEPIRLGAVIILPVVSHDPTGCQAVMAGVQKPTPTSLMLRRMTASAVLDALRAGGPMTGSDLIDATGLARPTVHVVCNDLIRLGGIRETERRRPPGRPPPPCAWSATT